MLANFLIFFLQDHWQAVFQEYSDKFEVRRSSHIGAVSHVLACIGYQQPTDKTKGTKFTRIYVQEL